MVRHRPVSPLVLQTLAWAPGRLMLRFFLRLKVRGAEHLKAVAAMRGARGVIFAASHVSEFDPIIILAGIAPFSPLFPMFYVSAPSIEFDHERFGIRRHIYGTLFFKSWGAYPLVRGLHDYAKAMETHVRLLRGGCSLCVFPTGGIVESRIHSEAHGGIGYLTEATGAPIVPVSIRRMDPDAVSLRSFFLRKHAFSISYGRPFLPNEILDKNEAVPERYQKAARKIMTIIEKL